MKKITIFLATALIWTLPLSEARAQYENPDDEIIIIDDNGQEEVIDVPEGMEEEVEEDIDDEEANKYLSATQDSGENPSYDDQVYIDRLQRLPTVIEMPYNKVVRKFIDRYTGRLRHTVSFMLGAQNFYMPIFEQALEAYELPLELKYLPVIESALKPKARSRVGATGLWQFMLVTGKQYGLEVNSLVDDRCDPIKASYAAARYLRDLHNRFGDWALAIASYNCGPENVEKAITRSNGNKDYWQIYPYLPAETRGYVPAFIAANYIMHYYCEHNIPASKCELPERTDTVVLSRDVHMGQIAALCNISVDELHALNPQYRTAVVSGSSAPATLRLPVETMQTFLAKENEVYNYMPEEFSTKRAIAEVNDKVVSKPRRHHVAKMPKVVRGRNGKILRGKAARREWARQQRAAAKKAAKAGKGKRGKAVRGKAAKASRGKAAKASKSRKAVKGKAKTAKRGKRRR